MQHALAPAGHSDEKVEHCLEKRARSVPAAVPVLSQAARELSPGDQDLDRPERVRGLGRGRIIAPGNALVAFLILQGLLAV